TEFVETVHLRFYGSRFAFLCQHQKLYSRDLREHVEQAVELLSRGDQSLHAAVSCDVCDLVGEQRAVDRNVDSASFGDPEDGYHLLYGSFEINPDAIAPKEPSSH